MCVRNNICWRIRDSDLSLLPWSWGLCIFVEQLCLVASRQVSRHLKGRSVCHASSSPPPNTHTSSYTSPLRPPFLCFFSVLHAGCPWAADQTSKQTEQQKNPSPRQGWSGGEMGKDLVCFLGQFHFTMMAEKASQDTATHTSVWLPGGIEVVLGGDTSSLDPIHSWLQPWACSLYLSWPVLCTLLVWHSAGGL